MLSSECGALRSHADSADFRRSMRKNSVYFCYFCVQRFLTERDTFFSRKGAKFRKVCVVLRSLREVVSHRRHGRHRILTERYGLTQTAQTFAEACGATFCDFCVQRFLT